MVPTYGEAVLVLGTRKPERQARAGRINKQEVRQVREQRLRPNAGPPNSLVSTPIEDWTNDDVWLYLMQVKNPWGHDNRSEKGTGTFRGLGRAG
jgi:DNA sulfur modification protein DndC